MVGMIVYMQTKGLPITNYSFVSGLLYYSQFFPLAKYSFGFKGLGYLYYVGVLDGALNMNSFAGYSGTT